MTEFQWNEADGLAYVTASARLMRLNMDEAQVRRVWAHLSRTAQMAASLASVPLSGHDEPAEVYCPAPHIPRAESQS